jgi:cytochrome P450
METFYLILGLAFTAIALLRYHEHQRDKNLPPGPPRLPLIGNLHQAPDKVPWRTYEQWTKKYGPIFSVQYGLNTVIMLGTHESARDLLEKRSNIYSGRPRLVMADDNVTRGRHIMLMTYGPKWRTHTKIQASVLNIRVSQTYKPVQDLESEQLVYELLSSNDFAKIYHRYTASLMFSLAYGKRSPSGRDPEILGADAVNENFLLAGRVGTWIVDAIPLLNYLPQPLAPWKKTAEKFFRLESGLHMSNMHNGETTNSWNMTKQIRSLKESHDIPDLDLAYNVGIIYEAGIDTTNIALEIFTLACATQPRFMRHAQEELDRAVGPNRLPTFQDKPNLPYVCAVVKEVLRWRPVSAGGIPHAATQDDEYMGYRIPRGATVIGNHWSIHMDEAVFPDPMTFRPERWLENPDLPLYAFGFGRRACTGQHVSNNSLFIIVARLLWAFEIKPAVDDSGREIPIDDMAFTSGFNSRPEPFGVRFLPRSDKVDGVVTEEFERAEKDVNVILQGVREAQLQSAAAMKR